jgi:hypothetical protein
MNFWAERRKTTQFARSLRGSSIKIGAVAWHDDWQDSDGNLAWKRTLLAPWVGLKGAVTSGGSAGIRTKRA